MTARRRRTVSLSLALIPCAALIKISIVVSRLVAALEIATANEFAKTGLTLLAASREGDASGANVMKQKAE